MRGLRCDPSLEDLDLAPAIVRQVAERHAGRAWVQPRDGGGAEFVITFGSAGSDHREDKTP